MLQAIKYRLKEFNFPYRRYMDRHRCIFIHVPKAAGTSINKALGKKSELGRLHLPWYVYQKANPKKFREYFKFAFVRNPWDRAYSAYHYVMRGGNGKNDLDYREMFKAYKDFNDFVINGLGAGKFQNIPLFLPQVDFVLDFNQKIVVDFLGRYESLEHDFQVVARRLGLKNDLPKYNVNKRSHDLIPMNCQAIEVIGDIYQQDINFFGYQVPQFKF